MELYHWFAKNISNFCTWNNSINFGNAILKLRRQINTSKLKVSLTLISSSTTKLISIKWKYAKASTIWKIIPKYLILQFNFGSILIRYRGKTSALRTRNFLEKLCIGANKRWMLSDKFKIRNKSELFA